MPGWLSKVGKKLADSVVDEVSNRLSSSAAGGDDDAGDGDGTMLEKLCEAGVRIEASARETVEICESTNAKRQEMIRFADEIQSTLSSLKSKNSNDKSAQQDASILDTIKDLTAGEKVQAAKELAQGLDQAALACAAKSVEMINAMEDGMDCLPQIVQTALEKAAANGSSSSGGDDVELQEFGDNNGLDGTLLVDLDRDIANVQTCITEIQALNLSTGLRVGLEAFQQLADKAKRSKSMFDAIQRFAADVLQLSRAISNRNVCNIRAKTKDLLRCIRMTSVMRQLALGAERLIKVLIDLFQVTAERISTLWAALDFAKDCMKDCLLIVQDAKTSCLDARDKSTSLITKSRSVKEELQAIGAINMQSVNAMLALTNGNEIRQAIDLAQNMDDRVIDCTNKVVSMVDRVQEGFQNIPEILTADIEPVTVGKRSSDPEPNEIEDDIEELETCRAAIEESNLLSAAKTGATGFSGVTSKAEMCQQMLQLMDGFAADCLETIECFLGVWDLESATEKIGEMCRLVSLGDLMKQFARQVKRLGVAIISLLQTSIHKFSSLDMKALISGGGGGTSGSGTAVESVTQAIGTVVEDSVDQAMDALKGKLNFCTRSDR